MVRREVGGKKSSKARELIEYIRSVPREELNALAESVEEGRKLRENARPRTDSDGVL